MLKKVAVRKWISENQKKYPNREKLLKDAMRICHVTRGRALRMLHEVEGRKYVRKLTRTPNNSPNRFKGASPIDEFDIAEKLRKFLEPFPADYIYSDEALWGDFEKWLGSSYHITIKNKKALRDTFKDWAKRDHNNGPFIWARPETHHSRSQRILAL